MYNNQSFKNKKLIAFKSVGKNINFYSLFIYNF